MSPALRGKDLRWTSAAVARDLAMAHSAFRNTLHMIENFDDEHGEERGDEVRMLATRMDGDFDRMKQLLVDIHQEQARCRKEQEMKEKGTNG